MGKSKQDYISQVTSDPNIPVFYQPWWLDLLAGKDGWDAAVSYEKDRITGIWPFVKKVKFGQSISTALPLTPFQGPYLFYPENKLKNNKKYSFEKKTLGKLVTEIRKQKFIFFSQYTSPKFKNGLPLQWSGFEEHTVYRSVLRGINNPDEAFSSFKITLRQRIKKFLEYGNIQEAIQSDDLFNLINKSFLRRNMSTMYTAEQYRELTTKLREKHKCITLYAYGPTQDLRAGILIVIDQDRAYLLNTGFDGTDNNAVGALIWHGIKIAAKQVSIFDFCGSMIPGIADFFQNFGATPEPYSQIRYFSSKKTKILYTLLNRNNA